MFFFWSMDSDLCPVLTPTECCNFVLSWNFFRPNLFAFFTFQLPFQRPRAFLFKKSPQYPTAILHHSNLHDRHIFLTLPTNSLSSLKPRSSSTRHNSQLSTRARPPPASHLFRLCLCQPPSPAIHLFLPCVRYNSDPPALSRFGSDPRH